MLTKPSTPSQLDLPEYMMVRLGQQRVDEVRWLQLELPLGDLLTGTPRSTGWVPPKGRVDRRMAAPGTAGH